VQNLSEATRPIMWNIHAAWLMYALFLATLVILTYGVVLRVREWKRGKPDSERLGDWGKRAWILIKEIVFQKRVRGSAFPGLFHSLIFYSFAVLVITTAVVAMDFDFHTKLFNGYLYVALTVGAELAGVFILVGVAMAAWRRYLKKPKAIGETTWNDTFALSIIALIVLTGFITEGLRIAMIGDRWSYLSPVGWLLSLCFTGVSQKTGAAIHQALWWTHTVAAFAWMASIPYTKFVHMLALPSNIFFSKLENRGILKHPDIEKMMEEAEDGDFNIGVEKPADFTWKQRLDLAACISCGRCEEVCPAVLAGQPFSPRRLIAESKKMTFVPAPKNGKAAKANGSGEKAEGQEASEGSSGNGANGTNGVSKPLIGNAFEEEFIWYCRTCTACMEVCPATIEHVDTVLDIRRNEVLLQGRIPGEAARALKAMESKGNPFGVQGDRLAWVESLGLHVVEEGEECDVIYWIGCCTTYDPQKQSIASDLCELLRRCNIQFGVLGADERCCGDPARVLGDERLFQEIAKAQVEAIKKRKFKVLLVSCPHCYNVLKNEYKQFGGDFNVVHHSEFLHEMMWAGELVPSKGEKRKIVYHDPCYLGRYQSVYEAPRQVLKGLPGAELLEMKSNGPRSMCCGGGGGHYWMDLKRGERINNLRVKEAQAAGADTIVTGCAYCRQMLDDSVKATNLDEQLKVVDIVSLVLKSLPPDPNNPNRLTAADVPSDSDLSDTAPRVCG
jgi:Fe-S oxidoreductase/nitrate reductase gamma subunit